MTTILLIKTNTAIFIAGDSQVTSGHIKLPDGFPKIIRVGNCLVAGTGSVGNIQQVLKRAKLNLKIRNVISEKNADLICPRELSNHIADLNFELPLEYKHYSPFSYLIGGVDEDGIIESFSVGDDGSMIEVETFFADGSGRDLALSILHQNYKKDLTDDQAISLIMESLFQSSERDLYTNNKVHIFKISPEGIVFVNDILNKQKENKIQSEKKQG